MNKSVSQNVPETDTSISANRDSIHKIDSRLWVLFLGFISAANCTVHPFLVVEISIDTADSFMLYTGSLVDPEFYGIYFWFKQPQI